MLQLQADQQHGDGRRTGDKPAGQAKHYDLSGGDVLAAEAPVNILRMRALLGELLEWFAARTKTVYAFVDMHVDRY